MTQLASRTAAQDFEEAGRGLLPGHVGIAFDSVEPGHVSSHLRVEPRHMYPKAAAA